MDGLIIINKARGWTSHDVVARLRRILSIQKIGHTGTLDPDAVGVLCICIGKGTKLARYTNELEKEYRVVMKLGVSTDTLDATGRVIKETRDFDITAEEIEEAFKKYSGHITQIPPMYSAVKIDGVPLYRHARKGRVIKREPRNVYIKDLRLLDYSGALVSFDVTCSRGTYVRTLCADIGDYLGTGAHMFSLERIRSGVYSIKEALTIDEVEELNLSGMLETRLIGLEQMLAWMPAIMVREGWDKGVMHGRPVTAGAIAEITGDFSRDGRVRIISSGGRLLAIGAALYTNNEILQGRDEPLVNLSLARDNENPSPPKTEGQGEEECSDEPTCPSGAQSVMKIPLPSGERARVRGLFSDEKVVNIEKVLV